MEAKAVTVRISETATSWEDIEALVEVEELEAAPSSWLDGTGGITGGWVTAERSRLEAFASLLGAARARPQVYQVRRGVCTDLNEVFWLRLVESGDPCMVSQVAGVGKKGIRFYNAGNPFRLEREWLYPLVRGREVRPFHVDRPQLAVLLPQRRDVGVDDEELKASPCVREYLRYYKTQLERRSSYRRYHRERKAPYWSVWDCGPYTFHSPKVVLREIAGRAIAAVAGTLLPGEDPLGSALAGKPLVPDHKLFFVATDREEEAHYLCAILNSSVSVRLLVAWSPKRHVSGKGFLNLLRPPRYRADDPRHRRLAEISTAAHAASGVLRRDHLAELDGLATEILCG